MFNQLILADAVFDEFFRRNLSLVEPRGFPVYDLYTEENGANVLEFALAGYEPDDLTVEVDGAKLVVSALKAGSSEESVRRRIAKRAFSVSFTDKDGLLDLDA